MSLEWFDRTAAELQDHLESICDKYDQMAYMSIERASKHPRIEFYVELEDVAGDEERDYFCTLNYDPNNEEFYMDSFEPDLLQSAKIVLSDIEDIIDAVHQSFHDYLNDETYETDGTEDEELDYAAADQDDEFEVEYQYADDLTAVDDTYYDYDDEDVESEMLDQVDVEWETPEVTAYMKEDEVEVTYQFGVVQETGDGVLRRVNRIWTEDDDLIKDETNFIFSKEEAGTIIAMIASNMDHMREMDYY
ncbi:hypothetical protein [Peribacillus kribbensis]|uniref:hypothetical protein n=1 Tax=Peribacillus kribbensis TaxID=356658 RepID=UPI000428CD2F|nr:hypothetical protein [Peribacillus kribbensis]